MGKNSIQVFLHITSVPGIKSHDVSSGASEPSTRLCPATTGYSWGQLQHRGGTAARFSRGSSHQQTQLNWDVAWLAGNPPLSTRKYIKKMVGFAIAMLVYWSIADGILSTLYCLHKCWPTKPSFTTCSINEEQQNQPCEYLNL